MISDSLRLTPRLRRCLDAIEHANGRVVTRDCVAESMRRPPAYEPVDFNSMRVAINHLREKLQAAAAPYEIETVWGKGYRLVAKERVAA